MVGCEIGRKAGSHNPNPGDRGEIPRIFTKLAGIPPLLDINMPGISGWEFFERYRALNARHRAQAVVVMPTTSTDPHDCARRRAQVVFFSKPLAADIIDRVVQDLLPHFWDG